MQQLSPKMFRFPSSLNSITGSPYKDRPRLRGVWRGLGSLNMTVIWPKTEQRLWLHIRIFLHLSSSFYPCQSLNLFSTFWFQRWFRHLLFSCVPFLHRPSLPGYLLLINSSLWGLCHWIDPQSVQKTCGSMCQCRWPESNLELRMIHSGFKDWHGLSWINGVHDLMHRSSCLLLKITQWRQWVYTSLRPVRLQCFHDAYIHVRL